MDDNCLFWKKEISVELIFLFLYCGVDDEYKYFLRIDFLEVEDEKSLILLKEDVCDFVLLGFEFLGFNEMNWFIEKSLFEDEKIIFGVFYVGIGVRWELYFYFEYY